MLTQRLFWAAALAAVQVVTGCSNPQPANKGDCAARIRYHGTLYRPHNAVNQTLPIGKSVGNGDIVGCDGLSAAAVDTVKLHVVKGVDLDIAVMTDDPHWRGIYVAQRVSPSSWPQILRR